MSSLDDIRLDDLIAEVDQEEKRENLHTYEAEKSKLEQSFNQDFPRLREVIHPQIQPLETNGRVPVAVFLFDGDKWSLQRAIDGESYRWYLSYGGRPSREQFSPNEAERKVLVEMRDCRRKTIPIA